MSCRQVAYSDSEQPMGRWYITPVQTCSKFSEHPGPVFLLIFNTRRKFVPATTCDSALITPNSCACEHSDPVMVELVASKPFPFPATIFTSLLIAREEWPPGTPPPPRMKPPPGLLGGAGAGRVVSPLVPLTQALRQSSCVSNLFALPRHPPKRKGWHSLVA